MRGCDCRFLSYFSFQWKDSNVLIIALDDITVCFDKCNISCTTNVQIFGIELEQLVNDP